MNFGSAAEITLMAVWSRHKAGCRSIGGIISDARAGHLPGVSEIETGHGFRVTNETAALAAMRGDRDSDRARPAKAGK